MSAEPHLQIFRLRVLLRMTLDVRLHAHHGAAIYALLSAAYGRASGEPPAFPDGVMPDVVEQCRIRIGKGQRYAFGLTVLAAEREQAGQRLDQLWHGLQSVGADAPPGRPALGGNFQIEEVDDLVAGRGLELGERPEPIAAERLAAEIDAAARHERLTLRFASPLRCKRPQSRRNAGHAFFDRRFFDPRSFLHRLSNRLASLGWLDAESGSSTSRLPSGTSAHGSIPTTDVPSGRRDVLAVELADNRLVWIDLSYGPSGSRKSLGGAVGTVQLQVGDPALARLLVLGQYARAGQSTRFGFGAYRIDELGEDPWPCERAESLVELALASPAADRATQRYGLASDRALQSSVVALLAPAFDAFFESSSLACRMGLGRHTASRRMQNAYRDGFQWALRADFHHFFDSIDHEELSARIAAYVADRRMSELLMDWVRRGAPEVGRGLPTGAPISPLLSNLLLDQFDEQIHADGARLVRYADHFLLLFRGRDDAQRLFDAAQAAAVELQLQLNESKTGLVDLGEPFTFVGFQFERTDRWQARPTMTGPQHLDDLDRHDAGQRRTIRQKVE
jgi:CRISPR-associated protein Cas1